MKAKWAGTCAKCETPWAPGDEIKPQYKRIGMTADNKPNWVRVPKKYVHAPKCPKVTPNRPGQRHVDPITGEILDNPPIVETPVENSAPTAEQGSLL